MRPWAGYHSWVDVAVFEDVNVGKALELFLTGNGLRARIYDDKLFRYFLFLRPPRVTYRVQVRQKDAPGAGTLLDADTPGVLQGAIRCPSCGSLRVAYPQMTRRFILPTILLHLGIIFRVIEHECYCEHCHFNWNLPDKNPRPASKPAVPFPFSSHDEMFTGEKLIPTAGTAHGSNRFSGTGLPQ